MARRGSRSRVRRSARFDRYDSDGAWGGFAPYVSVAKRRAQGLAKVQKLRKAGTTVSPVEIAGRNIATTFWGGAWCDNLERYADYANRIPRGRTYVRNGSVIDLQIGPGQVEALVSGSSIYTVKIGVTPVAAPRWKAICARCAGGIDSLVELLQARFSKAVMAHLCQQGTGLFPTPDEITFSCSCPDWASMCKHVAAVLYGVGARLDHQPDLLFRLRQVDEQELITRAGAGVPLATKGPARSKVLADEDLAGVFGVELAPPSPARPKAPAKRPPAEAARAALPASKPPAKAKRSGPGTPPKTPPGPDALARTRARRKPAQKSKPSPAVPPGVPPPKATPTPRVHAVPPAAAPATPARRKPAMTAAERRAVSVRMRRYWEERRNRKPRR